MEIKRFWSRIVSGLSSLTITANVIGLDYSLLFGVSNSVFISPIDYDCNGIFTQSALGFVFRPDARRKRKQRRISKRR